MKIPLLDLTRQYAALREKMEPAVLAVLEGGQYIQGEAVRRFEREMAAYLGVRHAVTVGNGTDALSITLRAAGVGAGDEVITTPFTFFATAEAIAAVGATPVFADICEDTFNLDPARAEEKITPRTRAILPVHIFGRPAAMDEIHALAEAHSLCVIEDACQAVGSEYRGKKAGALGNPACFSFFPTKNLGAYGDGGMITTDDDRFAVVCRALREHGGGMNGRTARAVLGGLPLPADPDGPSAGVDAQYNPYKYYNYLIGENSRLDALQATVLHVKLPYLDEWNAQRANVAAAYRARLQGSGVILPPPGDADGAKCVWHQFAVRHPKKQEMIAHLASRGIAAGVFYPVPLHLQKAFASLGGKPGDLPVAEKVASQSVCLPIFPELTEREIDDICACVREFAG